VPDLFAGRAATVFFRIKKGKSVTVTGTYADGKAFKETVKPRSIELPAIAHLWARARVTDLEDRFRLETNKQDAIRKEIIALAVEHTLLTRFTSFVVVDESEIVNEGGKGHKVVQPVHMPAQWEMEAEMGASKDMAALMSSGAGAPGGMPAPCMAPPPPPMSVKPSKSKKMLAGLFGSRGSEDISVPAEKPVSASERKAFEKAVEALKDALTAARSELSAGRIPAVGPVDKARKALLQVLGGSALGTTLAALQRLLRTGLLELVAALASSAPSDAPSLSSRLDRCLSDLKDAVTPATSGLKFWEKMI
jgi:Ca-activated chloride channel family protein